MEPKPGRRSLSTDARESANNFMKKVLWVMSMMIVAGAAGVSIMAARFEEKIKPNTFVGIVPVGDLSRDEAMRRIRLWWETEKRRELRVEIPDARIDPIVATAGKLGMTIDDVSSIQGLPLDSFWDSAQRSVSSAQGERSQFELKFKPNGQDAKWLTELVAKSVGSPAPARVEFENGVIKRIPEIAGATLDEAKLPEAVLNALVEDGVVDVPVVQAEKTVPDEALDQIVDVMSEFTTKFPVSQTSRNANLKLASGEIDGVVLMPGEIFSFNGHLGQRTASEGYKLAGVYRSGKHDVAIGGGICQVSTTLYNAVLFADLKIVLRSNHSMPVAYVPVGRDATVSYPQLDFKFQNNLPTPIAITRTFEPGKLTFRVLGKKELGKEVKVYQAGHSSWSRGVQYVNDATLPAGKQKVIEKGSAGHRVNTYRVVTVNGVEVRRELLNSSNYAGGKKIIAVNRAAGASAQAPEPEAPSPNEEH